MKIRTKKLIREVLGDLVFIGIVAALAYFLIVNAINRKCAVECGKCTAPFEWCIDYWQEKNMCGEKKDER